MKTYISLILATACALETAAAVKIDNPVQTNCPSAFAVVVDSVTYEKTYPSLMRYRDAVESDGQSTYILSANWESPSQLRDELQKLYNGNPLLEGLVLVGDIPVAMVRNAQHMTTAFKMDEDNFPFIDSSVPSDRFYDCLNLEFRYLQQDSVEPHLFYYQLTEDSPQKLNPTFYSARVRYPESKGGDKYEAISKFLDKAAHAKNVMKQNKVDRVVSFNGHGYNSDCLIAWIDEEKAYRENFPEAFKKGTGFKHWNFRMADQMSTRLLDELERPDIDIFMFHEHGAPTQQYISGYESRGFYDAMTKFKRSLYKAVNRAVKKGHPEEEVIAEYMEKYQLTPEFFADLHKPESVKADSLFWHAQDIHTVDLRDRSTMPCFVMFDACYNGSFHEDDNIAGEYIFNPGTTLVTQGNTRNVLQDRWTIEMIGLLSHGARIGQYNQQVATLEGHLIGDPTVRFASISDFDMASDMKLRKNDIAYWRSLIDAPYADIQSIALRNLAALENETTMSPLLLDKFKNGTFNTSRMEALKLLSRYTNNDFVEAVELGLRDPYERIARMSADFAMKSGDPRLLSNLIKCFIEDNERQRVHYMSGNALTLFPEKDVMAAIDDYYAANTRYNGDNEKNQIKEGLGRSYKRADNDRAIAIDNTAPEKKRISAIRSVRNNPAHPYIEEFFGIITDPANSAVVKQNMAEALGWFNYSHRKGEIADFCSKHIKDKSLPQAVRDELQQTLIRISN